MEFFGHQPMVIAHRGFSGQYPENTLSAFQAAIDIGVDAIELDVTLSSDRHLVVIHDDTLDRTTDGTGKVKHRSLAELKKLDAGSWFDPRFNYEKIPTLEEVLDLAGDRIKINIEIKPEIYEPDHPSDSAETQVMSLVQSKNLIESVLISSFQPEILRRLGYLEHHLKIALLLESFIDNEKDLSFFKSLNSVSLNPNFEKLSSDNIDSIHRNNFKVIPYTVNEESQMRRMLEWGVDGMFTNHPDRLQKIIADWL